MRALRHSWRADRGFVLKMAAGLLAAVALSVPASAQTDTRPAVPPLATQPAAAPAGDVGWLRVTGNAVNLRTRGDANSAAIGKVDAETVLWSLGREFQWYKVVPPSGVYSLVHAQFIDRQGPDRGVVKVEPGTSLRVRAGNIAPGADPTQNEVQSRLTGGTPVRILGEQGEWLRIAPPDGVYAYISEEYVQRISDQTAASLGATKPPISDTIAGTFPPPSHGASTQPTGDAGQRWASELRTLEIAAEAEFAKPKGERTWNDILTRLKPIVDQRDAPLVAGQAYRLLERIDENGGAVATTRPQTVTIEHETQPPTTTAPSPEQQERAAELEESRERLGFDAEGIFAATFAIPAGPYGLRYKLTDPITSKVRAYVEIPPDLDLHPTDFVGKYVGMQGTRTFDPKLEVAIHRVTKLTVLSPDRPTSRPRSRP